MPKILLVEDNEMNRDMLTRRLSATASAVRGRRTVRRRGLALSECPTSS